MRLKFNTQVRTKDESIATYVASVRQLSEFCEFGDTLEAMLRDRLVCGVNDDRIQRRLLELSSGKALQLAEAIETADQDTKDLATSPDFQTIMSNSSEPYKVNMNVEGSDFNMQVDTGASKSIMSEETYKSLCGRSKQLVLEDTSVRLRTYTGEYNQ